MSGVLVISVVCCCRETVFLLFARSVFISMPRYSQFCYAVDSRDVIGTARG